MKIESCPRIFSWPTYSSSRRGRSARSTISSWTPAGFAVTRRLSSSFSIAMARLCLRCSARERTPACRRLPADEERLLHLGDDLVVAIDDAHAEPRLVLRSPRRRPARARDRRRRKPKARVDVAAPGLAVADRAGLVPDDVPG